MAAKEIFSFSVRSISFHPVTLLAVSNYFDLLLQYMCGTLRASPRVNRVLVRSCVCVCSPFAINGMAHRLYHNSFLCSVSVPVRYMAVGRSLYY